VQIAYAVTVAVFVPVNPVVTTAEAVQTVVEVGREPTMKGVAARRTAVRYGFGYDYGRPSSDAGRSAASRLAGSDPRPGGRPRRPCRR
jgi:hypothetical protein